MLAAAAVPRWRVGAAGAVGRSTGLLAGAVLYLLLPAGAPPFLTRARRVPRVAVLLGMASHVPGGVGVFEGLMVLLLRPWLPAAALAARASSSTAPSTTCCRSSSALAGPGRRRRSAATRRSQPRAPALDRAGSPSSSRRARWRRSRSSAGMRAARLRRDAGGAGTPRPARSPPAARRDRDLALRRQHRRRRAAACCRRGWPAGSTPPTTCRRC